MRELVDTDAAAIAEELVRARSMAGSPVMGMAMTLVVPVGADVAEEALDIVRSATGTHPARVLVVVHERARGRARVDAAVGTGGGSGESAVITLHGPVVGRPESVVRPLLLPDCPVCVWWPGEPPEDPSADPIGALADRRITDAGAAGRAGAHRLADLGRSGCPGTTDLAWTRLTPWRSLLATALDRQDARVTSAVVEGGRHSPESDLMKAWLSDRLGVQVRRTLAEGPGLTAVRLLTGDGDVELRRDQDGSGRLAAPHLPDRAVELATRDVADLLSEELRHLDPDEIYESAARRLGELEARE